MTESTKKELTYSEEKFESQRNALENGKSDAYVSAIVPKDGMMGYVYRNKEGKLLGKEIKYFLMGSDDGSGMKCKHHWTVNDPTATLPDVHILIKDLEKIAIRDDNGKIYSYGFKKSNDDVENFLVIFKTDLLLTIIAANKEKNTVDWIDVGSEEEKDSICYCIEKMLGTQPTVKDGDTNEFSN